MGAYADYIAQIGQEIEQEIKRKHLTVDIPEFPGVHSRLAEAFPGEVLKFPSTGNLQQSVFYTQKLKEHPVLFYRDLTSYYKGVWRIVVFGKRVIRKLLRFLLEPLTKEVNENRVAAACALEEINQHLITRLDYEHFALEELKALKRENLLLQERLERLEAQTKKEV